MHLTGNAVNQALTGLALKKVFAIRGRHVWSRLGITRSISFTRAGHHTPMVSLVIDLALAAFGKYPYDVYRFVAQIFERVPFTSWNPNYIRRVSNEGFASDGVFHLPCEQDMSLFACVPMPRRAAVRFSFTYQH